jgi:hypothetical protein
LILLGILLKIWLKKRRERRIEGYRKADREMRFTLPDKENSFVRERLKGTLKTEDEQKKQESFTQLKDMDIRLDYTRKTITKLKASSLTPADRLEVNRISKTVTFFALKNALSPSETRSLNDCFSRLLKLCAKYAV